MHAPQSCERAPTAEADEPQDLPGVRSPPFAGLKDLLKKT
jgi:uncharacterized metal-binding protein YceD (DUF177 family)